MEENIDTKKKMPDDEKITKSDSVCDYLEVKNKDNLETDQFTEPEILDPALVDLRSTEDGDSSDDKNKWMGKQKIEQVLSSSEEDTSSTPEVSAV